MLLFISLTCFGVFAFASYLSSMYVTLGWLGLNGITFLFYYLDKRAARKSAQRVSERKLLMLSSLGCWPVAYWSQQLLRHKTQKRAFLIPFAIISLLQTAVIVALGYVFYWPIGDF